MSSSFPVNGQPQQPWGSPFHVPPVHVPGNPVIDPRLLTPEAVLGTPPAPSPDGPPAWVPAPFSTVKVPAAPVVEDAGPAPVSPAGPVSRGGTPGRTGGGALASSPAPPVSNQRGAVVRIPAARRSWPGVPLGDADERRVAGELAQVRARHRRWAVIFDPFSRSWYGLRGASAALIAESLPDLEAQIAAWEAGKRPAVWVVFEWSAAA